MAVPSISIGRRGRGSIQCAPMQRETPERLGIMSAADMNALLVPERLTQPVRLVA